MTLLLEVAVRALLIAAGTAAILTALRIRSAAARHAAWTAVVLAMLALPVSLAGGVRVFVPVLPPAPTTVDNTDHAAAAPIAPSVSATAIGSAALAEISSPASGLARDSNSPQARPLDWQAVLISVYLSGVLVLLIRLVIGTVAANRLRTTAAMTGGRLTNRRCTTPITVGWFAPTLILPEGWERWRAAQLDAVLTHEHEHARRHDPLVQWLPNAGRCRPTHRGEYSRRRLLVSRGCRPAATTCA